MIATEDLIAAIVPRLEAVKGPSVGGNYSARCPFHEDRSPSFSLNANNGLWQCHGGGCGRKGNAFQLARELGVEAGPATVQRPTVDWGLDSAMRRYGITVHPRGVVFPVRDHEGRRGRDHVRLHCGQPRFQYWGKGRTLHALVEWDLVREWGAGCGIAYVVEGDRDWLALAAHGWPAIGILGIEHFAKARQEAFGHVREAGIGALVLTPDNDEPGRQAAREWARILSRDGFLVGVRSLPSSVSGRSVKDVFDLFRSTGLAFEEWLRELPIDWREAWR